MELNNTTTEDRPQLELQHGQEIRVKGFPEYVQRITVGTVRGYAEQYNDDADEAEARAIANGHDLAFANQEAACMTSDHEGKDKELDEAAAAKAAAPEIESGQIVTIEGKSYRVRITGAQYANPVHFDQVEEDGQPIKVEDRQEQSTLLYLESVAVDYGGAIDPQRINGYDVEVMNKWKSAGFIETGRIRSQDCTRTRSLWVKLSDEAISEAHRVRKERIERAWDNRSYKTTEEHRNESATA